eukprot:CAMPEP_0184321278 /NCGR_PEP_ID=MMETSP1049-20130417/118098_1 /TAXON_ID=77928 /ORGANISM="Proteomonas sulcata, Strain CCMP704" /LENGTH=141 /DNA_ID=CAMNT_0026642013 /DNA_START=35 /DNA_END=457 /DNA_ORIENTATION=-
MMMQSEPFMSVKRRDTSLTPSKPPADELAWGFQIHDIDFMAVATKVNEGLQKCIFRIMGGAPSSPLRGGGDAVIKERDSLKVEVEELQAKVQELTQGQANSEAANTALRRCEELETVLMEKEESLQASQAESQSLKDELKG